MAKKLKPKGRAILASQRQDLRGETVLAGQKPKRGWWIIDPNRKRAYGKIIQAKRDGTVLWEGMNQVWIRTAGRTLYEQGCRYVKEIPPGFEIYG